ncbi:MAG: peptide deformylase [Anaerolineaceae bacterium]|nr:peptide deformylase [Anaerolineaceae bacterium]
MAIMDIVKVPNPVLRVKARPVKEVTDETRQLLDDMVETLRDAPGVGLAAPQVGISSRIIVIEFGDEEDEEAPKKLYTLINPEIVRKSRETELGIEGCLSIPGLVGEVERFTRITVKALNRFGDPVKIKASGWLARIFQHEIDHLEGVLFTDLAVRIGQIDEDENPEEYEAKQISIES